MGHLRLPLNSSKQSPQLFDARLGIHRQYFKPSFSILQSLLNMVRIILFHNEVEGLSPLMHHRHVGETAGCALRSIGSLVHSR